MARLARCRCFSALHSLRTAEKMLSSGLEQWRCRGSILIAVPHVIGTRGQRFGTPLEQADLEYIAADH